MNYYYYKLKDEIKGPLSENELLNLKLNPNTQVLKKFENEWKTLDQFEELNTLNEMTHVKIKKGDEIRVSKNIFIVFAYLIGLCGSYFTTHYQKNIDFSIFNNKIANLFSGNKSVCDYINNGEDGELLDAYIANSNILGISSEYKELRTSKFKIASMPFEIDDMSNESWNSYNESIKDKWKKFKNIKQYFESKPFSGFDLIMLDNNESSYTLKRFWSGDMAYLVPEKEYHSGYQGEYFSAPGYYVSTYRPSITQCYEDAAKYLIKDRNSNMTDDLYTQLLSFQYLESKYFKIEQNYPQTLNIFDSIFIKFREGEELRPAITQDQITKRTSANDGYIYDSKSMVWYKSISNTFKIKEKKYAFLKQFFINSLISILLITIVILIIKYKDRIVFE